jgi:hypothetical protein
MSATVIVYCSHIAPHAVRGTAVVFFIALMAATQHTAFPSIPAVKKVNNLA